MLCLCSAVETAVALKPSAGTLNVNAREFTPGAAAVAAAPRAADAPGGVQLSAAADVMWSDVGITDDADTAQDWSQWGYADQVRFHAWIRGGAHFFAQEQCDAFRTPAKCCRGLILFISM